MPTQPYSLLNLTLSPLSPILQLLPLPDTTPTSGWNLSLSLSTADSWQPNVIGFGDPSSLTRLEGAVAALNFTGDSAWIYGSVTQKSGEGAGASQVDGDDSAGYKIQCDGKDDNAYYRNYYNKDTNDGVLGGCMGLEWGEHTVRIEVGYVDELVLRGVVVQTGIGLPGASISNNSVPAIDGSNNINPFFQTSQSWRVGGPDFGGGSNTTSQTYKRLDTTANGASLIFNLPASTALFYLYGSVNGDHDAYSVTVDGAGRGVFNGSRRWAVTDQVTYFQVVNPNTSHTVEVTNVGFNNSRYFDLNRLVWATSSGGAWPDDAIVGGPGGGSSSSGKSMSVGAIVGASIGGVAALAIVALIGLFLFRRRDRLGFGKSRIVDLSDRYVEYADDDSPKYGAYGMGAAGSGHGITPYQSILSTEPSPRGTHNLLSPIAPTLSDGYSTLAAVQPNRPQIFPIPRSIDSGYSSNELYNPHVAANPELGALAIAAPSTPSMTSSGRSKGDRMMSGPRRPDSQVVQEQDGGPMEAEIERVPPVYQASWSPPSSR